jgi:hypothetical protein
LVYLGPIGHRAAAYPANARIWHHRATLNTK